MNPACQGFAGAIYENLLNLLSTVGCISIQAATVRMISAAGVGTKPAVF